MFKLTKDKSGSILFLLILLVSVIAAYQFISNFGEYLASSLGIDLVFFWLIVCVIGFIITIIALGSNSIKEKLVGK